MNKNEKLARQMKQMLNDIFEYFHPQQQLDIAQNELEEWLARNCAISRMLESFLACPSKEEIPNSRNLRPSDKDLLLLPGFRNRDKEDRENLKILSANLQSLSSPFFYDSFFDPRPGETNAKSYERYLALTRSKKHRKHSDLIQRWGQKLEGVILKKSHFTNDDHLQLIKRWKKNLFLPKEHRSKKIAVTGRWPLGDSIDIYLASRFILYFAEEFIDNPHKDKNAKIVCLLWLLIRLAIKEGESPFSLKDLLTVKIENIHLEPDRITIKTLSFPISQGLHSLLSILMASLKQTDLLFEGILVDSLDNLFESTSKAICPEESPILPSAFLSFPHLWIGHRIHQPLLWAKRRGLILSERHRYDCLLKSLKLPTQCLC